MYANINIARQRRRWPCNIYFSQLLNVFVPNPKCMCPKCKMYLSQLQNGCVQSAKHMCETVQIAKCVCSYCKMYLSKLENIFVIFAKYICPSCKMFWLLNFLGSVTGFQNCPFGSAAATMTFCFESKSNLFNERRQRQTKLTYSIQKHVFVFVIVAMTFFCESKSDLFNERRQRQKRLMVSFILKHVFVFEFVFVFDEKTKRQKDNFFSKIQQK